jgi:two-component system, cell cycle response regulator DivK
VTRIAAPGPETEPPNLSNTMPGNSLGTIFAPTVGIDPNRVIRRCRMPKTILVVEDDDSVRSIYSAALVARGYRVISATHGAEGVHFARRNQPDLILLDLRMPVMDGWGAAEYLRADPSTSWIPICAITAYELGESEHQEATRFFDCVLPKLATLNELLTRIESMIGPPDAAGSRQGGRTALR